MIYICKSKDKTIEVEANSIREAHAKARAEFGEGVSYTTAPKSTKWLTHQPSSLARRK